MHKGKFIVIDGTDGSGKATQTKLLVARLKAQGKEVELVEFPRHGHQSAWLVDEYLNGNFGTIKEVGPYQASVFYALDRFAASKEIKDYLNKGKIVVADRYVTANMGHQGAKIDNSEARKFFYDWINDFEYNKLKISKPDLTIILHVPAKVAQLLVDKKGYRDYVGGNKRDLHEADLNHLQAAEQVYLEMVKQFPEFQLVECYEQEKLLTKEKINDRILKIVN